MTAVVYNICLVQPVGYVHSLGLMEVCETLAYALRDLGYRCGVSRNKIRDDSTNILVGWHLLNVLPPDCIVYQLEQLSDREGWWTPVRENVLRDAVEVWDYSIENVMFLERRGIHARHVPLGGHPMMNRIAHKPESERDVDVLFYGSLNQRRTDVLERIEQGLPVVKALFGVYGVERDSWIARAKVVLNIHYYEAQIPEQVRVSYLLNNGCFVLSEGPSTYPGGLVTGDLDQLPELCRRFVADPEARREISYRGWSDLPAMVDNLRPVLQEAPCAV